MGLALLATCLSSLIALQPLANQLAVAEEVSGRVIDSVSRAPIAGVTVILSPSMFPPGAYGPLHAVTDENGAFTFLRPVAGSYRLQAQKDGFAALAGPFDEPTLDVAPGQAIAGLELVLRPGATITGRVLDAGGGPAFGLMVSALRRAAGPDGKVVATTARMAQTNDRGEFQLASLPDGEYIVIAAPIPTPGLVPPSDDATVMAPTYHPGTPDQASAQVITLAPAETNDAVQFAMVSRPAHHISGTVVDASGAPVARAIVMLQIDPRSGGPPTPVAGVTDEIGAFRIGGLVAGTYQIMIGGAAQGAGALSRGGAVGGVEVAGAGIGSASGPTVTPAEITIDDADMTGLTIVVAAAR